jgi:hypothetical protein
MREITVSKLGIAQVDKQPHFNARKKVYQQPKLQRFGKVHHLTQGTKDNGNDGALGFTKQGR